MGTSERIKEIEEEMKRTQYHKGTEHHIGLLRARLARLKQIVATRRKAGAGKGFGVKKEGDATVVIVGFPSVGKSTILNKLTNAKSQVAAYDFTTKETIPGIMEYEHAKIQLLDIPGLIGGAAEGKGRGREVIGVVRNSDLILIVLDANDIDKINIIKEELEKTGIRLNKKPLEIVIEKKLSGGITVFGKKTTNRTIEEVCRAFGILNANIIPKGRIIIDDLIDVLSGNCVYTPAIIVVNKTDKINQQQIEQIKGKLNSIMISAEKEVGLDLLREEIFKKLNFVRARTIRLHAEKEDPTGIIKVYKTGTTVGDVCDSIHKELKKKFKYALVSGKSVKFKEQRVGLEHVLADLDTVTIITRR